MNSVFVVSVFVAGVLQGSPSEMISMTPNCHNEQLVLNSVNHTNEINQVNVRYVGKCVNK